MRPRFALAGLGGTLAVLLVVFAVPRAATPTERNRVPVAHTVTTGWTHKFAIPGRHPYPYGIAFGADGAVWFTEYYANEIGRMSTSGTFSAYRLPVRHSNPDGIVAGPDGGLWFTESGTGKIGRISTTGGITEYGAGGVYPNQMVVGPDGALWYTMVGAVGRMTTSGQASTFPVGPNGKPWASPAATTGRSGSRTLDAIASSG